MRKVWIAVVCSLALLTIGCGADTPAAGPLQQSDAVQGSDGQLGGELDGVGCDPAACADSKPCHTGACIKGQCEWQPQADGQACDDGDLCSAEGVCDKGVCLPGQATSCDDDNPCTTDGCDAKTGDCTHQPTLLACDDNNPCTLGDQCQAGTCAAGLKRDCDDDNICTLDSCDSADTTGSPCRHSNVPGSCDDGDACTTGDGCKGGVCQGAAKVCDDDNPCTADDCVTSGGASGCTSKPVSGGCSDGDGCTVGDQCKAGACVAGSKTVCDDGNPCSDDLCDPKTGCGAKPNAAKCDDGNACTLGDGCKGGACASASTLDCDDGNSCTVDACLTKTGCHHTQSKAECSDGDACTTGDICKGGSCAAGNPIACNDGNPCTADACKGGVCLASAVTGTCTDNNPCTTGDGCKDGSCKPSGNLVCDDGNPCSDDQCDPSEKTAKSACKSVPNKASCDDGNPCTVTDGCKAGQCTGSGAPKCDDGNPCTDDACSVAKGGCVVVANSKTCDDGNACTTADGCTGGKCAGGKGVSCDDNDPCTTDACDPKSGCKHNANTLPCSDDNICTLGDACKGGKCTAGKAMVCNDGNPCTADKCDPKKGCVQTYNTSPCDDGNKCTEKDTCVSGACKGSARVCDDGNACTTDYCDAQKGCSTLVKLGACNDGDACTSDDACYNGFCVGKKVTCTDGKVCTTDTCDKKDGCQFPLATGTPCGPGTCNKGACVVGDSANPAVSCLQILQLAPQSQTGVYWLDPDGKSGAAKAAQAYCDMKTDGGGWTLLLKVDGKSKVFERTTSAWTTTTPINAGSTDLSATQAKFASYSTVPFTALRVGMKGTDNQTRFISFAVTGTSLYARMKTNAHVPTKAGRKAWKSLLHNSSLQPLCNQEGLNTIRCKLGITNNQENNCGSPDSYLGLGCDGYAAGNYAHPQWSPDNGGKATRAFAWVFAR